MLLKNFNCNKTTCHVFASQPFWGIVGDVILAQTHVYFYRIAVFKPQLADFIKSRLTLGTKLSNHQTICIIIYCFNTFNTTYYITNNLRLCNQSKLTLLFNAAWG
jgi:hypothetical protein